MDARRVWEHRASNELGAKNLSLVLYRFRIEKFCRDGSKGIGKLETSLESPHRREERNFPRIVSYRTNEGSAKREILQSFVKTNVLFKTSVIAIVSSIDGPTVARYKFRKNCIFPRALSKHDLKKDARARVHGLRKFCFCVNKSIYANYGGADWTRRIFKIFSLDDTEMVTFQFSGAIKLCSNFRGTGIFCIFGRVVFRNLSVLHRSCIVVVHEFSVNFLRRGLQDKNSVRGTLRLPPLRLNYFCIDFKMQAGFPSV